MYPELTFNKQYFDIPDFNRERAFAKEQVERVARGAKSIVSPVISNLRDRQVLKETFVEMGSGALIGGAIKLGTRTALSATGGLAIAVVGGALAGAGIEYFKQVRYQFSEQDTGTFQERLVNALNPTDYRKIGLAAFKGGLGAALGFEILDFLHDKISLTPAPEILVAGWNNLSEVRNQLSGVFTDRSFINPDPLFGDASSLKGLAAAEVARDLLETDLSLQEKFGNIEFDPFSGNVIDKDGVLWHHAEIFKTYIENDSRYQGMLEAYMDQMRAENHPNHFKIADPDLIWHFIMPDGQHDPKYGPLGELSRFKVLEKEARRKFFASLGFGF